MKFSAKYTFTIFLLLGDIYANAQSDVSMNTYWYNRDNYNPAAIARTEYLYIFSNIRQQWIGIDGAPKVFNVQASEYIHKLHSAFGLSFISDEIGVTQTLGSKLSYAFRLSPDDNWSLSLGLSGGYFSHSINGSIYEANTDEDPSISYENDKIKRPDANVGFEFQNQHLIAGVSSTHLFSPFVSIDNQIYSNHRYAYVIYKNNNPPLFNYSAGLQTINSNDYTIIEGNILFRFKRTNGLKEGPVERFDVGLTYNSSHQLIVLLGINVTSKLRIGYAFDQSFSRDLYQNSTHELMMEYRIPNKASSTRQRCGEDFFWYR